MQELQDNVAWGVEFGGSAVRIIRLERTEEGYVADCFRQTPMDERWSAVPDPIAAVGRLGGQRICEPLSACVPDKLVMFRLLSLPNAGADMLDSMVASQLEVLIPSQTENFVTGYRISADPYNASSRRVLLCAARKDTLSTYVDACKLLADGVDKTVPSILALATVWRRLYEQTDRTVVLVDVGASCTSLAVVCDGQVVQCGVIDQGADHWTERMAEELQISHRDAEAQKLACADESSSGAHKDNHAPACAALHQAIRQWSGQLRELYQDCVSQAGVDIPRQDRPDRCLMFGLSASMFSLETILAEALGLDVQRAQCPRGLRLAGGATFELSATAIGAALCALEKEEDKETLGVSLTHAAATRPRASWRSIRRSWLAGGAWLVIAILLLYVFDVAKSGRANETLTDMRGRIDSHGSLTRQLTIGKYLESAPPTAMDVMDRVSSILPKNTLLTSWVYSRNGDLTIAGLVPNEKGFFAMYEKLAELGQIEWKQGRPDNNKFRFDVSLKITRSSMKAVTTQPAKTAKTKPTSKPTSKPVSKPASSAATQPTGGSGGKP